IFAEIKAQNRFWSRYMTIYFAVYIIEICYLAYIFLFVQSSLGFQKLFFIFIAAEFLILIIGVTLEGSKVVNKNCRMHKRMQRIALKAQLLYRFNVRERLKMDQMAMNYRNVSRICFTLLNGYRINSKMFQLIFYYITLLFMMIFRDSH